MPTRSASDYVSYVKSQVLTQTATAVPQARNVLRYEGGAARLNSITQVSDMRYVSTGRLPPARVRGIQVEMTRANPKRLSTVSFLGSGGPHGQIVNRPAARFSGTNGLVVLQHNLIQNANQSAGRGGTSFTNTAPSISK
jgi:hypothetical protein